MKVYAIIAALTMTLTAEMALAQTAPKPIEHPAHPATSEVLKSREGRVQKGEKRHAKRLVNKDRKPAAGKTLTADNKAKKKLARQHKQREVAKVKRAQTPAASVAR